MDVTERIDCFNIDNRLISQTGINGLAELSIIISFLNFCCNVFTFDFLCIPQALPKLRDGC